MTVTQAFSGSATLPISDAGSGQAVVFLHAGVADQRSWGDVLETLKTASGLRTISYDRRGFGSAVSSAENYSRMSDLLAVLDACSISKAILVGNSQGGRVALDLAITHPNRVSGLVLIAPAVSGAPSPDSFPDNVQAVMDAIEEAEDNEDLALTNQLEANLWLDGPSSPAGRVSGATRELFLEMNAIALNAKTGDCKDNVNAWAHLSKITVPTTVMCGDLDLPHLQDRCRSLAAAIPNAQFVEVRSVAHLVGMEAPDHVASAIVSLLQ
jgi:pimeloyl-ACP methyl ester carboxylesterase